MLNLSVILRVYPRACGGTITHSPFVREDVGLSPRLRGNGSLASGWTSSVRSIPALAGERTTEPEILPLITVYPRACGGTIKDTGHVCPMKGLSPRLRGNVKHCEVKVGDIGSIPALAGER